jgi:hypothetical protein
MKAIIIAILLTGALPLPKTNGQQCPANYRSEAHWCVPTENAPLAVPKGNAACPSGWLTSGSFCIEPPRDWANMRQCLATLFAKSSLGAQPPPWQLGKVFGVQLKGLVYQRGYLLVDLYEPSFKAVSKLLSDRRIASDGLQIVLGAAVAHQDLQLITAAIVLLSAERISTVLRRLSQANPTCASGPPPR